MQFDSMIIEVDGSMKNPMVVATVVIWSCLLSLLSFVAGRRWNEPKRPLRERARLFLLLVFLFVATPIIQFVLGNLLYHIEALLTSGPGIMSVGFWGGPPVFPAWIAALTSCLVALQKRRAPQ